MHDNNYLRGEIDDFSMVIILFFLFLFTVGSISIFYIIPLAIIHFIDGLFLGNIISWIYEMIGAAGALVLFLFIVSTVPKNPITWYIYFRTPVITIFNRNEPTEEQRKFIKDVEGWIKENANSEWRRSRNWAVGKMEYQFLRSSDAMAFKLRWT